VLRQTVPESVRTKLSLVTDSRQLSAMISGVQTASNALFATSADKKKHKKTERQRETERERERERQMSQ